MPTVRILGLLNDDLLVQWLQHVFQDKKIQWVSDIEQLFFEVVDHPTHLILLDEYYFNSYLKHFDLLFKKKKEDVLFLTILFSDKIHNPNPEYHHKIRIYTIQPKKSEEACLKTHIYWAEQHLLLQYQKAIHESRNETYQRTITALNEIGISLSNNNDLDALLHHILYQIRKVTHSDAGSIYLVKDFDYITPEERKLSCQVGFAQNKSLIFKTAQNDSVDFPFKEVVLPVTKSNLAAYVAITGEALTLKDAYEIPEEWEYQFNKTFDQSSGYRSKSFLVVPMKNHKDEIVGVMQLINRKRDWETQLMDESIVDKEVLSFDDEIMQMVSSVASQAAIAIENFHLVDSIQNLFDEFVAASAYAVEQRDPTMQGHSERVARLAKALARAIDKSEKESLKTIHYSDDQLLELYYAALLHDFGKIHVPVEILLKPKRLFDWDIDLLKARLATLKSNLREKALQYQLQKNYQKTEQLLQEVIDLDSQFDTILTHISPIPLTEDYLTLVRTLAHQKIIDYKDQTHEFLDTKFLKNLTIPKGTVNNEERTIIQSHVEKSYQYLKTIPWTPSLKNIPEIAYGHHEFLDGSGYPRGLTGDEINFGSQILCIVDIYDALVSPDRPYKAGMSPAKAISILSEYKHEGKINSDIFEVFLEEKIHTLL